MAFFFVAFGLSNGQRTVLHFCDPPSKRVRTCFDTDTILECATKHEDRAVCVTTRHDTCSPRHANPSVCGTLILRITAQSGPISCLRHEQYGESSAVRWRGA